MVGRGTGDSFDRGENLLRNLSVVVRMTRHCGHPEMRLRTLDNLLPESFLITASESSIIEGDTVQSERDFLEWTTGAPSASASTDAPTSTSRDFIRPGRTHVAVVSHLLAIAAQITLRTWQDHFPISVQVQHFFGKPEGKEDGRIRSSADGTRIGAAALLLKGPDLLDLRDAVLAAV